MAGDEIADDLMYEVPGSRLRELRDKNERLRAALAEVLASVAECCNCFEYAKDISEERKHEIYMLSREPRQHA